MNNKLDRLFFALGNRIYFLIGLIIIVVLVMSSISPYFFNIDNLLGMTRFGAVLALVSLGEILVIIVGGGGIDLSVGSMVSLSGVLFGLMVKAGVPVWPAAVACVIIGGLLGGVNGLIVAKWGMVPLIGTLGTMYTFGALALVLTNGNPISGFPSQFGFLGQGMILKVPVQVLLVVVPIFIIVNYMVTRTRYGRDVYLVGVNEQAARFAGISVVRTRFILYTLSGVLAGFGAVIMASWLMTARADVGNGLEMQAITVAMLGGTNIAGGAGTLVGGILALLIVTMIASGLELANINTIWQLGILGFVLLGAVALNQAITLRELKRKGIS